MATQKDFRIKNGLIVQNGNTTVSQGTVSISDQISGDTGQLTITNGQLGSSFMRIGMIGSGTANSHIRTDSTLEFHIGQSATSATPSVSIDTSSNATFAGTVTVNGTGASAFRGIDLVGTNPAVYFKDSDASTAWHIGQNGANLWVLEDTNRSGGYNNIRASWDATGYEQYDGNINIRVGSLTMGNSNTVVIDSSRNLTNIGTINSGAITSSGALTTTAGVIMNSGGDKYWIRWSSGSTTGLYYQQTGGEELQYLYGGSKRFGVTATGNATFSGTISNSAFTIPNSIGLVGQVLKVPSTGTTLEWGADSGLISDITNFADNRILTASGSTTINGESNLTFNGSTLTVNADADFNGANADLQWDSSADSLIFNDDAKATFGTGSDLQIYHDGSNSYISEVGTGGFYIQGQGNIYLQDDTGAETYARFQKNNAVKLFFDNDLKFATSSSGIDVTGTVTSDGLTVEAVSNALIRISDSTSANQRLDLQHNGGVSSIISGNNGAYGAIKLQAYNGTDTVDRLSINTSGNATFSGTISSGAITSTGILTINEELSGDASQLVINNTQGATFRIGITGSGANEAAHIKTNSSEALEFHIGQSAASTTPDITFLANGGGIAIQGTTVIDSSRNLSNIGTISSGSITSGVITVNNVASDKKISFNRTAVKIYQ